jgi:hypothetical protein
MAKLSAEQNVLRSESRLSPESKQVSETLVICSKVLRKFSERKVETAHSIEQSTSSVKVNTLAFCEVVLSIIPLLQLLAPHEATNLVVHFFLDDLRGVLLRCEKFSRRALRLCQALSFINADQIRSNYASLTKELEAILDKFDQEVFTSEQHTLELNSRIDCMRNSARGTKFIAPQELSEVRETYMRLWKKVLDDPTLDADKSRAPAEVSPPLSCRN